MADPKPISRPSKSDRSRALIADAARRRFAANGFERTTIRDIAGDARIDPAMVIRYFGSKDALFAKVSEFNLDLPDLRLADRARIGEILIRHYLGIWEGDAAAKGLPILLRSAASNDHAARKIQQLFQNQVLPAIAAIGPAETAAQRAALIGSQLLGLALCRYILKLPPLVAMSGDDLVHQMGPVLQHYVTGE